MANKYAVNTPPSVNSILGAGSSRYLDPRKYASFATNAQFGPLLRQLALQRARADYLRQAGAGAVTKANQGYLQSMDARAGQDQAMAKNMAGGVTSAAQSLANLGGSKANTSFQNTGGNFAGLIQAMGANAALSDRNASTSAKGRVAQMQANQTSEFNNRLMDIDRAITEGKKSQAETWNTNFEKGLQLRQQLMAAALGNRGSMINQDILQKMGSYQLEGADLSNQQAQQNMALQGQNAADTHQMNMAQLAAFKQQLKKQHKTGFNDLNPGDKANLTTYLSQGMVDENGILNVDPTQAYNTMTRSLKSFFPHIGKKAMQDFVGALVSQLGAGSDWDGQFIIKNGKVVITAGPNQGMSWDPFQLPGTSPGAFGM